MAPKNKRDAEEIERVRELLPIEPSDEIVNEMKRRQKSARFVYRVAYAREPLTGMKKKMVSVRCTACGEERFLKYSPAGCDRLDNFGFIDPYDNRLKTTGSPCRCTGCGAFGDALHIQKIRPTYLIERNFFLCCYNIRGHFVALSFILFKECDKNANVIYYIKRGDGLALIGGRLIRYTGYVSNYFGVSWDPGWLSRAAFNDTCDEWDADEIFMNRAEFDTSSAQKSALEEFIRDKKTQIRVFSYLGLWNRFPQVENLVRCGLSPFVSKVIERATGYQGYYYNKKHFYVSDCAEYFNRKKVKPHEMIGLSKNNLHLANTLSLEALAVHRFECENKFRFTDEQRSAILRATLPGFKKLTAKGVPVIKGANYLSRRANEKLGATYFLDYLNLIEQIQGEIPPELMFPKNLKAAHDDAVLRLKIKTDKEIDEKIIDYSATLVPLWFTDKETGLCIRSAASQEELIKEGKILSHCVATYAKSVARRETAIFFIRRLDDPDTPFFTLP